MWATTIVSEYMAMGVISLGVAWSWLMPLFWRPDRRPGGLLDRRRRDGVNGILIIVGITWLFYHASHSFWWGTARYGIMMGEDWSRWMTVSPWVIGFLAVLIATGMLHIIKATYDRSGVRPAILWALAATAAAVWPEHIVAALRALTGI